jgi:hypothetical protein
VIDDLREGAARLRPGVERDEPGWWVAKYAVDDAAGGPCEASALLERDGFNVDDEIVREAKVSKRLLDSHETTSRQQIRFMFLHFLALMLEDDHAND